MPHGFPVRFGEGERIGHLPDAKITYGREPFAQYFGREEGNEAVGEVVLEQSRGEARAGLHQQRLQRPAVGAALRAKVVQHSRQVQVAVHHRDGDHRATGRGQRRAVRRARTFSDKRCGLCGVGIRKEGKRGR